MRGTTKPNDLNKALQVESDGAARMFTDLTWGDPGYESMQEVSRSHSSEEACESRQSEGLKNKRQTKKPSSAILTNKISGREEIMNVLNKKGLDAILKPENLNAAYLKVKANKGAAGVDGIGVEELSSHIKRNWKAIETKLRSGTYEPGLLKVVPIPKPGGGERELNIPNTQDRLIQQAIGQVLNEVFEPLFSEHSYGYRTGKSAHDAVKSMKDYVSQSKRYIVDLDIHRFFDEVSHDILMHQISEQVSDKSVLKLIGKYLRCGKLVNNRKVRHQGKGIPQGGPLSPLLANIYLTALDRQLEQWQVSFVRYADDITIYATSQQEATELLERTARWVERKLKLQVNWSKSGVRPPNQGNFLGYRVEKDGRLALSEKTTTRFKSKVKELLDCKRRWSLKELIEKWQQYIRGWWNYCQLSEWFEAKDLSAWCRRHIRKLFWQRWHNWKGRRNALKRLGAKAYHQKIAHSGRGAWRISKSPPLQAVLNNKRLNQWGFITPDTLVREAKS